MRDPLLDPQPGDRDKAERVAKSIGLWLLAHGDCAVLKGGEDGIAVILRREYGNVRCGADDICEWKQEDSWDCCDRWDTDCGHAYSVLSGGPQKDGIDYCCYCGRRIEAFPAREVEVRE